jgi:hypothetical protein
MGVLVVSFEIAWESQGTYDTIYNAFTAAVRKGIQDKDMWIENTSLIVARTDESVERFVNRVAKDGKLRHAKDRVLVLDADVKTGATWGNVQDGDIYNLIPFLKKL